MSEKANFRALLPMIVFLVLFIGTGIALTATGADMPFYQLSATVAIIPAIVLAILQGKDDLNKKIGVFLSGVGEINIITMCMIFLLAGGFASVASAIGGVKATVNFGLSLLPPSMILPGLFLIGAFISTAMGTSMGTVAAIAPIAVGVGEQTDIPLALLLGVVMSGAMFGDNLSMISDTTIAATRTQECDMRDKFKVNSMIVVPAAVVVTLLYLYESWSLQIPPQTEPLEWVKVIPYLVVLGTALAGMNVMIVLVLGLVFAGGIGLLTGSFGVFDWFGSMGSGITDMGQLIIVTLLAGGMLELIQVGGGIDYVITRLTRRVHNRRGAELSIAALVSIANCCTANNTIAIITVGPIAKGIADRFGVDLRKSASILDTFSCFVQGLIPYGAQLLMAAGLTALSPLDIMRYLYYPVLMGAFALLSILFRFPRRYS